MKVSGQEEGAGGEVKKKEQGAECIVKVLYRFLLRTVSHRFLSARRFRRRTEHSGAKMNIENMDILFQYWSYDFYDI